MDAFGETYSVNLDIKARDIYGNTMYNEDICTYFSHQRFIVVFNFIFDNLTPVSQYSDFQIYQNETFDYLNGIKTFNLKAYHPFTLRFDNIHFNFTLLDGMLYKNGLLVKYYSNNNFIGKPLYISRIPSSHIASDEYLSNWYLFHT